MKRVSALLYSYFCWLLYSEHVFTFPFPSILIDVLYNEGGKSSFYLYSVAHYHFVLNMHSCFISLHPALINVINNEGGKWSFFFAFVAHWALYTECAIMFPFPSCFLESCHVLWVLTCILRKRDVSKVGISTFSYRLLLVHVCSIRFVAQECEDLWLHACMHTQVITY